jgi:uncharacterized membrane protein YeaQ/YmgE (transglycosylase-associated protein family)
MLDLFGWDVGMSTVAALLLVLGALLIGVVSQYIGDVTVGFEWVATGVAALIGGYLGSEALGAASAWGPVFDGLYMLPALIGAVVVGFVIDAILRYSTEGSYVRHAQPI